jgi:hypothetical protein
MKNNFIKLWRSWRLLRVLLFVCLALMPSILYENVKALTLYESYTTSDIADTISANHYYGQTFNATSSHDIGQVQLKISYDFDKPTLVYAEIYDTSGGYPTGSAIASGNISGTLLNAYPGSGGGDWLQINFYAKTTVTIGTVYAVVIHFTGGGGGAELRWSKHYNGGYTGGKAVYKSGVTWYDNGTDDNDFRIYGGYDSPSLNEAFTYSNYTSSSVNVTGTVVDYGGAAYVQCKLKYGYTSGVYPYETTNTTVYYGTGINTFCIDASGLPAKTRVYFKGVITNLQTAEVETTSEYEFSTQCGTTEDLSLVFSTTAAVNAAETMMSHQIKLVYCNGRYWIVTPTQTGAKYVCYSSSIDGTTWSTPTTISTTKYMQYGEDMSIATDGTYLHFVYTEGINDTNVYYRRGLANADGTVTWTSEQTAVAYVANSMYRPTIAVDSNGYPWITYGKAGNEFGWVTTSSTNNGTWTTKAGFPYNFPNGSMFWMRPKILTLSSGKMYLLNTEWDLAAIPKGISWNGTAWGISEDILTETIPAENGFIPSYSATVCNDIVYFAWVDSTNRLKVVERSVAGTWSSISTITTGLNNTTVTQLTAVGDSVYLMWIDPTSKYIIYLARKTSDGDWSNIYEYKYDAASSLLSDYETTRSLSAIASGNKLAVLVTTNAYTSIYFGYSELATVSTGSIVTGNFTGTLDNLGNNFSCNVSVEYGLTTSYGSSTTEVLYNTTGAFLIGIPSGLYSWQIYHYRLVGDNPNGLSYGADATFLSGTYPSALGDIVFKIPNPSDTSMVLNFTKASGATSTVIRYKTDNYPTSPIDGTSAYDGIASQCTVSNLTAGTTYYFSAWGHEGTDYSFTPAHCLMNTLAVALLSGGEESRTPIIPVPTVPASANQVPDVSGFNLEPFTSIINYFVTAPGGLGMPVNYAWEVLAIGAIVAGGAFTYMKTRIFFIAYFVLFILTVFFVGLHLVQGYLVAAEIIIGAGVWAIERYLQ